MFAAISAYHSLGLLAGALSSLFWTIAYALIIRRGAKDKTFGMPLTALGANLAWEVTFLIVTLEHDPFDARLAMILPWTLLDFAIVYQAFRYGKGDFASKMATRYFYVGLSLILVVAAVVLRTVVRELHDAIGWYAAFGQNLMMSVLFVAMILRRDSLRGQSIYIALGKLLGTFFAFVMALFWSPPTLHEHWKSLLPDAYTPIAPMLVTLYAGIFLFDVVYAALVLRKARDLGVNAWRVI